MSIGNKIANARKEKHLTQEQLADLMGVSRQSVSRWESDQAYPEMEKIVRLAEVLAVTCDYLLNDAKEERKSESAEPTNAITRLLYGLKGKEIRLKLYPDAEDTVVENAVCVIQDFDGLWMRVICTTKKKSTEKLLPVSSVASIQYVDKGGKE